MEVALSSRTSPESHTLPLPHFPHPHPRERQQELTEESKDNQMFKTNLHAKGKHGAHGSSCVRTVLA